MKNKEQLSLNLEGTPPTGMIESDRGVDLREVMATLRQECEPPALSEERALKDSGVALAATDELMEQIVATANLDRAWRQVKRNRGAPGPDGVTIQDFESQARAIWPEICQQLLTGTYRPQPVRRKVIAKENGGERLLGIPNVVDRLIQQAILQILTPLIDPKFSDSSHGFRPDRSCHGAARQVQRTIRQGYRHIVNIDLSKFFDRVNHDVLMRCLSRHVGDKRLLKLVGRYLRAGVMIEGVVQPTEQGAPQGGPLSPFLSNVLLDVLDKELESRGHRFVRYADDFVIFVKSSRSAERVHHSVGRFLREKLKLIVNEDKSSHGPAEGCEYLGFQFKGRRVTIKVSPKKLKAFKRRVKELTGRSRGISMERRLTELRRYLRGWIGYFGLAQQVEDFAKLDAWIRRRIRMCFWKQWRYPRTKIRKLLELGVSRRLAILHGISRKGYWRMSRTPAMRIAMPNDWLKEQGVLSIAEQWFHLAPLRRTA